MSAAARRHLPSQKSYSTGHRGAVLRSAALRFAVGHRLSPLVGSHRGPWVGGGSWLSRGTRGPYRQRIIATTQKTVAPVAEARVETATASSYSDSLISVYEPWLLR